MGSTAFRCAVVAAVNSDEVLLQNLARSPVVASGCIPLIAERGYASAGAAYNAGLRRANADYIIFAHQDVYLPQGWESRLIQAVNRLETLGKPWGILGVWGVRLDGGYAGRVWCSGGNREHAAPVSDVTQVASIDEIVIVVKSSVNLQFDESLPGFHLYATDLIAQAARMGHCTYVFDGPVVHNSRVNPQVFDAAFFAAYRYMQRKWADQLPLRTCTVPVTRLGWPLYRAWLRREIRRRGDGGGAGGRHDSPVVLAQRLGYENPVATSAHTEP